jgi:hypothetical protein
MKKVIVSKSHPGRNNGNLLLAVKLGEKVPEGRDRGEETIPVQAQVPVLVHRHPKTQMIRIAKVMDQIPTRAEELDSTLRLPNRKGKIRSDTLTRVVQTLPTRGSLDTIRTSVQERFQ